MDYATVDDLRALWREMTEAEEERAEALIPIVSAVLREEARRCGKDLDEMIELDPDLGLIAKSVTCDVVARTLMTSTDAEPMSQMSESAGGYSVSGTYLVPGGGLFIKESEYKRLGLRRQHIRGLEIYGTA